jgi:hypothetical protein
VVHIAPWVNDDERRRSEVASAAASVHAGERFQLAGRLGGARMRFAEALDAARDVEDGELFARAALGLGGIWVHEHRSVVERAHVVAFQRQACGRLDENSALAVRLRTRLAAEESYATGDPWAVREAVCRARAHDDPVVLAEAFSLAHHCLLGPEHAGERLALARELIEVSARTGRSLDASMGLLWQTVDLFLAGDARAERSLEQLRSRHLEACVRYVVLAMGVMQAIRAGELERAEQLASECYECGVDVGDVDALGFYGAQLVLLRWLQGRQTELLPYLTDLRGSPTLGERNDAFDAGLAAVAATAGLVEDARAALQRLRSRGLAATRNSSTWLVTMEAVVEAAYQLDDAATAREAYSLLAPHASLPAMASLAVACFGSVHRALGVAATVFGDLDLAVAHLELAVEADLALANRPCHAMSCATLAGALERRGDPDDRDRIVELRRRAIETARACGMGARADAWTEMLDAFDAVECRRDGRFWRVCVDGRAAVVPHSVGMAYVARLLEAPGVEISAAELVGVHEPEFSARQAVIDDQARAAYRRRAGELQAEIDEADDHNDLERAARARAEFDALVDEVQRTTGLLGRRRAFADEAERARTSVQKAIKRAIARIADADATLGRELSCRILTGARCVYLARV